MLSSLTRATACIALALALALGLATAVAPASATVEHTPPTPLEAPAPGETTWSITPASANAQDDRISLRHEVDPGSEVTDQVAVTNFSTTPATFALYASDGRISADGSFDLLPPAEQPEDGGSWIALGSIAGATARQGGGMTVTLDAGSTAVVPVTIAVPADATPGDHPAGIVAELVPDDAAAVQLSSRVGVRVHLRVAGDITPSLESGEITTRWTPSWNPFAPGMLEVTHAVTNDGNVRLGADTRVSLAGPAGIAGTASTEHVRELLPSDERTTTVRLEVWPVLFGWGEVTLTPLAVGEDEVSPSGPMTGAFTAWLPSWSQLVLLLVLVAAVFAIRAVRRRSAVRMQARIDAAVAEARVSARTGAEEL
jgi:hypothetical protein